MEKLIEDFKSYFDIAVADDIELVKRCQALRYQVYCVEHFFLDAAHYPDQLERDRYDYRSSHALLIHRRSGAIVGTVRLVLAEENNVQAEFPIEEYLLPINGISSRYLSGYSRRSLAEISRFAVSKEFKRRSGEAQLSHGISQDLEKINAESGRRLYPHVTLGLFKAIIAMSAVHKVEYWYAIMEPALIRLLQRFGIYFVNVGPLVDCHGLRQPCIGRVDEMLEGIKHHSPLVWEFITEGADFEYLDIDRITPAERGPNVFLPGGRRI